MESDDSNDDEKYGDNVDVLGQKVDPKERVTIRNLRLREDTAKYLLNLDENSATYNPKTRSMLEKPTEHYESDNFTRYTGDVQKANDMMKFAWQAEQTTGIKLVNAADPTQGELLYKKFNSLEKSTEPSLLVEKYGGQEYLKRDESVVFGQSEVYVEYSAKGEIIKGEKKVAKSRYQENILINNHTFVWGSFWDGEWGYKCCHSTIKNSYCGGSSLIDAKQYTRVMDGGADRVQKAVVGGTKRDKVVDETEEYNLKKIRKNDPMAQYLNK